MRFNCMFVYQAILFAVESASVIALQVNVQNKPVTLVPPLLHLCYFDSLHLFFVNLLLLYRHTFPQRLIGTESICIRMAGLWLI